MNWADFLHADCDAINFGYTTLYSIFLTFKSTVVVLVRPLQGPKDAIKNYIKTQKIVSVMLHISGTIHHMIVIYGTHV